MQPSICARITSGLTGTPQSTAQTTRSTLTLPLRIDTSATCATNESNDSCTAMPCATPARRGLPQPALSAASLSTPAARGLLLEQREAEGERIAPGRGGKLVDHRFHHVRGVRVADRAPPQRPHRERRRMQRTRHHRQVVDALVDALDRGRVDAVLDHHGHRPAGHDRLADDGVLPERDAALARRVRL